MKEKLEDFFYYFTVLFTASIITLWIISMVFKAIILISK